MRYPIASLSFSLTALLPQAALACACCTDPGERFEHDVAMGEWEAAEIAQVTPTSPARLYLSACGFDCVHGIAGPQAEYDVGFEVDANGVTLALGDGRGPRGTLVFPWPESYTWFGTDTGLTGKGGDIYTELRFRGAVAGTGDFAQERAQEAELVLSGFGNRCITVRSFEGWILSVSGADTEYRLFGTFSGY